MNLSQSLHRLNLSRQALLQLTDPLDEADLNLPQVEGVWSIKDLLGHIAAWDKTLIVPLQSFIQGKPFQPEVIPDHDAWNALQASSRQGLTCAQVRQEILTTRADLIAAVGGLTEEQLTCRLPAPWGGEDTLPDLISGLAWHEEEHTKTIQNHLAHR